MQLRLGILGVPDSPYVLELQRAARALEPQPEVRVVRYADLQIALGQGLRDWPAAELDALLVRSMPLGTLEQIIFRMDCLQAWEARGVRIINPPRSLEVAIDKWLTLQRLAVAGLPVPRTVVCQSREVALEAYVQLGGDVLVKPLFGGEGRGIVRVQDKDTAWRVFGALQQMGQVLYVQQFVQHVGYDVRVLFVGERHFAIKRRAQGAWLTNLSQGNLAEPHVLSAYEWDLASRSARVIGGSVLGVDLLPTLDGSVLVLEVNAVPGWKGTSKALDVDIARAVVQHACDCPPREELPHSSSGQSCLPEGALLNKA